MYFEIVDLSKAHTNKSQACPYITTVVRHLNPRPGRPEHNCAGIPFTTPEETMIMKINMFICASFRNAAMRPYRALWARAMVQALHRPSRPIHNKPKVTKRGKSKLSTRRWLNA